MTNKYWTLEKCKEDALKYKTRKEWSENSKGYNRCHSNGWLTECCQHMKFIRNYRVWTKDDCINDALKYKTRSEWYNNSYAYKIASKNGWLDDCCGHMQVIIKPNNYWTLERCKEDALKYKTKKEWAKNSSGYNRCREKGWLDECCQHMEILGHLYKRMIYAYEFIDDFSVKENRSVYVGLTYDERHREFGHKRKDSAVYQHIIKTNLQPIRKKISDYIEVENAMKLENETVEKYKNDGWNILNKNKTGALGSNRIKWTKEKCLEESMKYKTRSEFDKKNPTVYMKCVKNKWLQLCDHLPYVNPVKWTKEKCKEVASRYSSIVEFRKNSKSVYEKCRQNNWLNDICDFEIIQNKSPGYWTKENCQKEAMKYSKRYDFQKLSRSAYSRAWNNGWLDEICSHMVQTRKPNGYWHDKERCHQESLKYANITDFIKKSSGAYHSALQHKWLDEICQHFKEI